MTSSSVPIVSSSESRLDILPGDFRSEQPRSLCWGAILAGLTAALALQVLFLLLGAGLGFALYTPITDENPIANFGAGALILHGVSAVLSLWFGGWVAGVFTPQGARRNGWLHGFCVWCAAAVAGVLFVSVGAGLVSGGIAGLVAGGFTQGAKPAAAMLGSGPDLAKDALTQSSATLASFLQEALSRGPSDAKSTDSIRAEREVSMGIARFFHPAQESNRDVNRSSLERALVSYSSMSEADAQATVTGWTETFEKMKADLAMIKHDAEAKARIVAEQTSKTLAMLSLCAFVGFAMGGLAASYGGHHGVQWALKKGTTEALHA